MHTYFIHSPKLEAIKIGKSAQPQTRLKDLGTANPDELVILGTIEGDHEKKFHEQFVEYRIHRKREWFSLGPNLMDFLKAEFKCVLQEKKNGRPKKDRARAESWTSIVNRAEKLFGCGLRHTEWIEFYEAMDDEICGRVMQQLEKELKEEWEEESLEILTLIGIGALPFDFGVELSTLLLNLNPSKEEMFEELYEEADEVTQWGYDILFRLEEWWPWVEGWNIKKKGEWLDVYLFFQKPDHPRLLEDLLRCLAVCGRLSEYDYTDFIRLNVAFGWRSQNGAEFVGEIQRLPILDDMPWILFSDNPQMLIITMDEQAGFRLLGDKWYERHGLPTPARAIEMAKAMGTENDNEEDDGGDPVPLDDDIEE